MDFATAWQQLERGQRVRVSNGQPRPNGTGLGFKVWRSHNFEGRCVEFIGGPPRAIRVEMDEVEGARVGYVIAEGSGDLFEPVQP